MKNNKHVNLGTFCKCYKCNSSMAIYCLGLPGTDSTVTTFSDQRERKRYMKKHCCPMDNSVRCVLYSLLCSENGENDES